MKNNTRETDISKTLQEITDQYSRYAGMQVAICGYTLYERSKEQQENHLTAELWKIIKAYLSDGNSRTLAKQLGTLRKTVIARMEAVSAFTDTFLIYEYILNRMELKFEPQDQEFDNDEEARRVLQIIFADTDNTTINLNIQMMLAQLPVRLTRIKFMDILEDSLALYENSEQSVVEKLLYMVRSAAGLYQPESMKEFPELLQAKAQFEKTNLKELTEEEYYSLTGQLNLVTEKLNSYSDYYADLQEVINPLYILLLTEPNASELIKERNNTLKPLTEWLSGHGEKSDGQELPEELYELFGSTEGELERYAELVHNAEGRICSIADHDSARLSELGLKEQQEVLELCSELASPSLFANLEEESAEPADKEYIERTTKTLQKELELAFAQRDAKRNRAIMAAVMKELPVFFSSRSAVMDYVRYSLDNCRDYSEKRISVDLLCDALSENTTL